jgi:uncharacterized protein YkwD
MVRALALVLAIGCGSSASSTTTARTTTTTFGRPANVRAPAPPDDPSTPEGRLVAVVNRYRVAAGVPRVSFDGSLSEGCRAHAVYMKLNRGTLQLAGLRAHTQDPSLPGATPDGAACAKAANLFQNVESLETAVDGWMAGIYHRVPILSPDVERVGVGYTQVSPGRYAVALQFVWSSQLPYGPAVIYPASGGTDIAIESFREEPNPIPAPTIVAGYAITVQLPPPDKLTHASATLVDATGAPVPFWLSSPEHPASPLSEQRGLIAVIPKQRLRTSTRYTATIAVTQNGTPRSWTTTFTTIARTNVDATDEARLLAATRKPVLLRGTVRSTGQVSEGNASLDLVIAPAGTLRRVAVEVPFSRLGVTTRDELDALAGKSVEAEDTPLLLDDAIHLEVAPSDELQLSN